MGEFKITGPGSIHITFGNGVIVSVIFFPGTHSDNYSKSGEFTKPGQYWKSETAEVMVWDRKGEIITADIARCEGITANYQNVDQVMAILNRARAYRR